MGKAGGIIGLISGIFAVMAAIFTLVVGGVGAAFEAKNADAIVGFGWYGLAAAFLVIVFGAVAIGKPSVGAFGLLVLSLVGAVLSGMAVAICLTLGLLGGLLAAIGSKDPTTGKRIWWPWSGLPVGIAIAVAISLQIAAPSQDVSETPQTPAIIPEAAPTPVTLLPQEAAQVTDNAKTASDPSPQQAKAECPAATGDMTQSFNCKEEELVNADVELNAVYKAVMSRLSLLEQDALRASQRSWLMNIEECGTPVGAGAGGMLNEIMASECKTEKTIERTKFLQAYMPV